MDASVVDADNLAVGTDHRAPRPVSASTASPRDSTDDPSAGKRWTLRREPSIWWLFPFVLIFTLGFGGSAVPKINVILSLVCRDHFASKQLLDPNFSYPPVVPGGDNPQCRTAEIQATVARFQLYLNVTVGLLAMWVSPRLGNLSDRYGRTRFLALNSLGALVNDLIMIALVSWPDRVPTGLLFVGSALDGISGSFTTAMALVQAYACDCTPFKTRGAAFGLFQGALFFGVAIGPTLAAFLIHETRNIALVFYISFIFECIFILGVLFVVPESTSQDKQLDAREKHRIKSLELGDSPRSVWRKLNPLNLLTPLSLLWPAVGRPSPLFPSRRGANPAIRRNIVLLALIDTSVFTIAMGAVQIIVIYMSFMFNWGSVETSLFASVTNVVRIGALFVLLPLVTRLFPTRTIDEKTIPGCEKSEVAIIRVSLVFDVLGYAGYAVSRSPGSMVASGALSALGAMASPTLQSALSKHVPQGKVGELLGTVGLLHALGRVVGPTVLGLLYSKTVATFPQAVFVTLAGFLGVVLGTSLLIQPHVSLGYELDESSETESDETTPDEYEPLLSR